MGTMFKITMNIIIKLNTLLHFHAFVFSLIFLSSSYLHSEVLVPTEYFSSQQKQHSMKLKCVTQHEQKNFNEYKQ